METSVNNLTQNESTGLVHYGPNDQRVVELVRLQDPSNDPAADAAANGAGGCRPERCGEWRAGSRCRCRSRRQSNIAKPLDSRWGTPVQAACVLFLRQLGQLPNPQIFKLHRCAFRFEAQVARLGIAVLAAGDFLAVDPQTNFAVDGADVVVVPFAYALGQILARESSARRWARSAGTASSWPCRRGRRRRWVVNQCRLLAVCLLELLGEAVVEHLHFDAAFREHARLADP